MRRVWTEAAVSDLSAAQDFIAQDFIAQDNAAAAKRPVALVLNAARGLRDFPAQGRIGRRRGTRELVVPRTPYIIAYRVEEVTILRLLHGRRRWPDRF